MPATPHIDVGVPPLQDPKSPPGGEDGADAHVAVIRPPRGWQILDLGELWRFRELIYFLAWRDVKVRYKQTVLGAAWAVLQPGLMMVVFTIFFSRMAGLSSGDIPYPIFVYAGLLPWTFFSAAVLSAGQSVVASERLVTKVYFPRLALPFAAVGAALVDFLIAFCLLVGLALFYPGFSFRPTFALLLVPVLVVLLALAALAVGTLIAGLHVAYRDFRYVTPFLVQLWMFATPSIYMQTSPQGAGGWVKAVLALNPLTGIIDAFRAACLGGPLPWLSLGISASCVVLLLVVSCYYFRRIEHWFADII